LCGTVTGIETVVTSSQEQLLTDCKKLGFFYSVCSMQYVDMKTLAANYFCDFLVVISRFIA
jgi:hypothetical protein